MSAVRRQRADRTRLRQAVRPGQVELAGVQDQSDRVVHARGPTAELLAFTLYEESADLTGWRTVYLRRTRRSSN